jgi:hypothetical protein
MFPTPARGAQMLRWSLEVEGETTNVSLFVLVAI